MFKVGIHLKETNIVFNHCKVTLHVTRKSESYFYLFKSLGFIQLLAKEQLNSGTASVKKLHHH